MPVFIWLWHSTDLFIFVFIRPQKLRDLVERSKLAVNVPAGHLKLKDSLCAEVVRYQWD